MNLIRSILERDSGTEKEETLRGEEEVYSYTLPKRGWMIRQNRHGKGTNATLFAFWEGDPGHRRGRSGKGGNGPDSLCLPRGRF